MVQELSLRDPERFWLHHADKLHWHKNPSCAVTKRSKALPSGASHDHWSWFPDGEISTSYNCVDRHVENGNGDTVAIIWESPVTGAKEKYTYKQLLEEVEVLAGVLREEGVRKGDVVIIYSMLTLLYALGLSRAVLKASSAYDSRGAHCGAGYHPTRSNPFSSFWGFRGRVACTAH